MKIDYPVDDAHTLSVEDGLARMQTDATAGLSASEAADRQNAFGRNVYEAQKQKSAWLILLHQFKSPIVYLLVVGAAVSFFFGDNVEAIAILAVIFINAFIGFVMEMQARTSMQALKSMDVIKSKVIRDGKTVEISSEDITPGDIVYLEAGDVVPGDGRLIESNGLECDESSLTGESLPAAKNLDPLPADATPGDRLNMVFKGTAVVNGNGKALITGIASHTELGKITSLVETAKDTDTPLDKRLQSLSKKLIVVTLLMTAGYVVVSLIQGKKAAELIETAIALAVASIPEGLPIVATVALAYGVLQMARRNAIVKKLSSVETLGSTSVILTDKTGTLTENKIHVDTFGLPEEKVEAEIKNGKLEFKTTPPAKNRANFDVIRKIGLLCNNATIGEGEQKSTGDPLEISLLHLSRAAGDDEHALREEYRRIDEMPFNSDTKIMATLHEVSDGAFVAAKGAEEQLLEKCDRVLLGDGVVPLDDNMRRRVNDESESMAANGLRVLAFAYNEGEIGQENFADHLIYAGMIGFLDPPRLDVRDAILSCRKAGIKIVMITGDHPKTALNIARKTGVTDEKDDSVIIGKDLPQDNLDSSWRDRVLSTSIFARTTPQQKLDIAGIYQEAGNIVAMTGDGINDAPALKKANVGIAMGLRGTQVAKETASIVLKDDSFTTIAEAVSHGREIFGNIQKFVVYLVSCNLSEILIVTTLGLLVPASTLVPLQILFLNLVTDVFPALALGVGEGDETVMKRSPADTGREIVSRKTWIRIGIYAVAMTLAVVFATMYYRQYFSADDRLINNIAFATLTFAQLLHIFNMASPGGGVFINEVTRNVFVWLAIVLCAGLLVLVFVVESLHRVLHVGPMPADAWLVSIGFGFLPLLLMQLGRRFLRRWSDDRSEQPRSATL